MSHTRPVSAGGGCRAERRPPVAATTCLTSRQLLPLARQVILARRCVGGKMGLLERMPAHPAGPRPHEERPLPAATGNAGHGELASVLLGVIGVPRGNAAVLPWQRPARGRLE